MGQQRTPIRLGRARYLQPYCCNSHAICGGHHRNGCQWDHHDVVSHAQQWATTPDLVADFATQYAGDLAPIMTPYCFQFAADEAGPSTGGVLASQIVKERDGWPGVR